MATWVQATWESRSLGATVSVVCFALSLWLALFLLRRGSREVTTYLGIGAMVALALFYLQVLLDAEPGISAEEFVRRFREIGWCIVVLPVLWLAYAETFRLRGRGSPGRLLMVIFVAAALSVGLIVLMEMTELVFRWSAVYRTPFRPGHYNDWQLPLGSLWWIVGGTFIGSGLGALVPIGARLWRDHPSVSEFRSSRMGPLFVGAAVIFAASAIYMVIATVWSDWSFLPALLALAAGLGLLAVAVTRHNLFLDSGTEIAPELVTNLAITVGGSGAVVGLVQVTHGLGNLSAPALAVVVAAGVLLTQGYEPTRSWLERLLSHLGWFGLTPERQKLDVLLRREGRELDEGTLPEYLRTLVVQLCRDVASRHGLVALWQGPNLVRVAATGLPEAVVPKKPLGASPLEGVTEAFQPGPHPFLPERAVAVPLRAALETEIVGLLVMGERQYSRAERTRILLTAEAMGNAVTTTQLRAKLYDSVEQLRQKKAREDEQRARRQKAEQHRRAKERDQNAPRHEPDWRPRASQWLEVSDQQQLLAAGKWLLEWLRGWSRSRSQGLTSWGSHEWSMDEVSGSRFAALPKVAAKARAHARMRGRLANAGVEDVAEAVSDVANDALKRLEQRAGPEGTESWQEWVYLEEKYFKLTPQEHLATRLGYKWRNVVAKESGLHKRAVLQYLRAFLEAGGMQST